MKNITTILITLLSFLMVSCASYNAIYDITLTEVERPADAKDRYGVQKIESFKEEGKTKYSFEDEVVKVIWIPTSSQFLFTLTNKTKHSIQIIWDEAVYVDENGLSKRVMHTGVNYIDRNNPQPPTTVVRGATISDLIFPTDNISYWSGLGWVVTPLFPNKRIDPLLARGVDKSLGRVFKSKEEFIAKTKEQIGKSVQVLLPLKIENVVNEYIFSFIVNDVKVDQ